MARFASVEDIELESVEMELRATFPQEGKYGIDPQGGSAMERLGYVIDVNSKAPAERIARLVERAEAGCHAANSLRVPVTVEGALRLNGEEIAFAPPPPPELSR